MHMDAHTHGCTHTNTLMCVCVCVCRNLKFDETPNYNYCRKLLREVFEANGYSLDYVYDWTVKQQVYPP